MMAVSDEEAEILRDLAANHGPISRPVDRLAHLPEVTRAWLESLREDDLKDLNEAVRFMHSAKTISKFSKWLLITIVGMIIAGASLGEAIAKFWGWIFRGGSH